MVDRFTFLIRASCENERSPEQLVDISDKYILKITAEFGNAVSRAYARGGLGLKPLLELDILQNFITCAKEINCFRILFAC